MKDRGGRGAEKGGKAWSFLYKDDGGEEDGVSLTPSFSVARTESVGDCRVAINAIELTPGCPFAGKVRLKERRNGRQLPRSGRAR